MRSRCISLLQFSCPHRNTVAGRLKSLPLRKVFLKNVCFCGLCWRKGKSHRRGFGLNLLSCWTSPALPVWPRFKPLNATVCVFIMSLVKPSYTEGDWNRSRCLYMHAHLTIKQAVATHRADARGCFHLTTPTIPPRCVFNLLHSLSCLYCNDDIWCVCQHGRYAPTRSSCNHSIDLRLWVFHRMLVEVVPHHHLPHRDF